MMVRRIVRLRWRHRLGPVQIASRLGMQASTVHVVARRLGHADPAVTLRIWAHVLADQADEVATVFASLVDTADEGPTDGPCWQPR